MDLSFLPEANWLDVIVLIFLVRGAYIGLSRGLSTELSKLLGAVLTVVFSLAFYDILGDWLASHSFLSPQVANFISFLLLVFILITLSRILRVFLFSILHLELFGGLEKWGGFALGLGRSLILASLFLYAVTLVPISYFKESAQEKSLFAPYLTDLAPKIVNVIFMFKPQLPEE